MTWEEPGAQGWELGWEQAKREGSSGEIWSETGQKLLKIKRLHFQ